MRQILAQLENNKLAMLDINTQERKAILAEPRMIKMLDRCKSDDGQNRLLNRWWNSLPAAQTIGEQ